MRKAKPIIKGESYYCPPDGSEPVLWNSLTDEQKEAIYDEQSRRGSIAMTAYYNQHLDEYKRVFCKDT